MAGVRWRRGLAMTMAAAAITLAGCGGSGAVTKTVTKTTSASSSPASTSPARSSTSTATSTPAAGPGRLNGKDGGFSTAVPHGWRNGVALVDQTAVNLQYVVLGSSAGGFLTNINVVREATSSGDVVAVANASIKVLHAAFPTLRGMSALHPLTVAGSSARAFNYFNQSGSHRQLHVQQIVVLHGGYAYTITYTALASKFAGSLNALSQVVGGWRWQ